MKRTFAGFIILCCWAIGASAEADSVSTQISGFGTLGGLYQSRDDVGFVRNYSQSSAPGRHYLWRPDTRFGIQAVHTLSPQWQLVGQAVVRDQETISLNSSISRAYINYRPDDHISLRIGRMADATWLMSDYQDVGYAYPWVRPPMEFYGFIPFSHFDGADLSYSVRDEEGVWRLKGVVGRVQSKMPIDGSSPYQLESQGAWGGALIREAGPLKLRVGITSFRIKNATAAEQVIQPLLLQTATAAAGFGMMEVAAEANALSRGLEAQGGRVSYASLGVAYDDGRWMFQSEVSNLMSDKSMFRRRQGYVSVGYHVGDFLPYVTYAASLAPAALRVGHDWTPLLGPAAGQLQTAALAAANILRSEQHTVSLGVRWDFLSNAALKIQWDHVRVKDNGWGLWYAALRAGGAPGRADLVSATVDFVF